MSDKDPWTAEEEVGTMMVIVGLTVSGPAIYAIVHLLGWLGLAVVWFFCGLSSRSTLELVLEGEDDESMEKRRADITSGTIVGLLGGVVLAITIFFVAIAGVYEQPAQAESSAV